ncbi:predicted protein [Nematostella vectensis]|uniref:tetraacyldisaccharide 4'-kinase n=1 Tax=Nematostella vectensis TaxID=45351 RepID=A7T786_NEMVE|nr:predicted protein [Nematostella vectensis]|eukprot:XP_001620268.1 hypothetical protein NEMVEDRAFT_v1g223284 [Nematostella vectensis]
MYKTFRALQDRWREIGAVPRSKYNDTWRNYHHHVERFYDLLHLSNDFRDLDFKHNLEEKLKLIERAETLATYENVNDAFKELQQLHKAWKEDVGPVSKEQREEVWQKFSDASKKVHDRRHEYFRSLKSQFKVIIEKKLEVIAKIDAYDTSNNTKHSDWQKSIKEIEALRQAYFNVGKLPYAKSEEVWQKFKAATKKFNHAKNTFYKEEKRIQQENLDKKNALIELAESIKDSEDWETTTNTMKKIQADWKKIGHVPRKFSDDIWKRFKAACNHYFDRYHNRQDDLNKEQQAFVEDKKALLDKVKAVDKATLEEIEAFIAEWKELGQTPRSARHLESKFYKQVDKLLEGLSMSKEEIAMLKFKNLVDGYLAQNNTHKLDSEQMFVRKKIDEVNKEIQQLENNLSFFSNAKDDNPLVVKVQDDINEHKKNVKIWKKKLKYLRTSFDKPIIAVGNLSVGGTGKTPQIEYLIRLLKANYALAVLSRGYGRKTKGFVLADATKTAQEIGDEPLQFYKKFSAITVAVDENRVHGIAQLKEAEVILLDDAFQHRKVKAGFYVLLTKFDELFSNDFVLPVGNLRERRVGVKRADVVVVTKCPDDLDVLQINATEQLLRRYFNGPIFFSIIKYADVLMSNGENQIAISELNKYEVLLVTGIANPNQLLQYLDTLHCKYTHQSYPDHHQFTASDIAKINKQFSELTSEKKMILTTEKDFVRLSKKIETLFYLPIETTFINRKNEFDLLITDYVKSAL